ncbi:MAG: hypothetical protein ACRDP5_21295 [Streptosporangiaceae bacterium]
MTIEDLELERYGFRFAASPVGLATTYRDGTNCLTCQDPARTAERVDDVDGGSARHPHGPALTRRDEHLRIRHSDLPSPRRS